MSCNENLPFLCDVVAEKNADKERGRAKREKKEEMNGGQTVFPSCRERASWPLLYIQSNNFLVTRGPIICPCASVCVARE